MKLWIRTQDKTRLLEANDIRVEPIQFLNANNNNELNVIDKVVGGKIIVNSSVVAKYDTVDRALQVLDEIQNALVGKVVIEQKQYKTKSGSVVAEAEPTNIKPLNQNCVVYQMPKE